MSEPYGAFVKLQIARSDLARWLDTPPADPARWTDWREIGGQWHFSDGVKDLSEATGEEMSARTAEAGELLSQCSSVRDALRAFIHGDSSHNAIRSAYDSDTGEFVAVTLFFDENLVPILAFLALVRGSEDWIGAAGHGVALIHDFVFAPGDEATIAALAVGPRRSSRLLTGDDRKNTVAAFQNIADAMLSDPDGPPPLVDHLDELR